MLGLVVAIVGVIVLVMTQSGSSTSFAARASAICRNTQHALAQRSTAPTSIAQAMQIERQALASYSREVAQLEALRPEAAGASSFGRGLADDRQLLAGFRSMIDRPDFVELAITLPGHPQLVPAWLKAWLAREHTLLSDAQPRFSQAGVPACEKSLG